MSNKTYAITLNGVEYIMTAREIVDISSVVTGINPTTAEYTGSAINVSPISEKVLVEGTDYSITYSDNISVGSCLVTINGLGDYSGSTNFILEITEASNSNSEPENAESDDSTDTNSETPDDTDNSEESETP